MQRWWQSLRDFFYGERVRLPTCSFCERSYTKAGPFIEGGSGHMVCGDCLQQIAENMPEGRVPSPQTESRQTGVIASECGQPDSPYRTPSSIQTDHSMCSFCETSIEGLTASKICGAGICSACVVYSIQILDDALANRK